MGQFLPEVRTYPGVPPVSLFASITGTPIVINTLTSTPYYLAAGNVVTALGGGGGGGGVKFTYSTTAPVSPTVGDEWVNSNLGVLFIYINDGTSSQWVEF